MYLLLGLPAAPAFGGDAKDPSERVRLTTVDGVELHGTFYPAAVGKPCVLLLHDVGAGHSRKDLDRLAKVLHERGFAVLSFDFRGHGDSTTVDVQEFWAAQYAANRAYVKGGRDEEIAVKDFDGRYYPVLVNDIAAAKAYLDRKNDQERCDVSNLVVVGVGEGATLGALWLNAEWHRHRYQPATGLGTLPRVAPKAEGENILAAVWLSLSPKLGNRAVNLPALLDLAGRQKKTPMALFFAGADERDRATARQMERHLIRGQKLIFTGAVAVPGAREGGEELLAVPTAKKAIADYIAAVYDDEGREWEEQDARQALFVWRDPRSGRVVPANGMGSSALAFSTYESFLPAR